MKLRGDERAVLLWISLDSLLGLSCSLWLACDAAASWISRAPGCAGGGQ